MWNGKRVPGIQREEGKMREFVFGAQRERERMKKMANEDLKMENEEWRLAEYMFLKENEDRTLEKNTLINTTFCLFLLPFFSFFFLFFFY